MPTQKHTKSKSLKVEATGFDEFVLLNKFPEENPDIATEHQLRWWLRNAEENGLDECVVKVGRRWFIHRPSFLRWFASKRHH